MGEKVTVECRINGQSRKFHVYPMTPLSRVLREEAGLTATKEGCLEGECGACSILLNGELVNSCLVPVVQACGVEITTLEGIVGGKEWQRLERAFLQTGGTQCGICTPGVILAVVAWLRQNPRPDPRTALSGNLCRCTGYAGIFRAMEQLGQEEGDA